jgi:type VI secretion system protein VasD
MRSILPLALLACLLALSACATGEPKKKAPIRLEMSVKALSAVNTDDRGRPSPIVVRIYELKSDAAFKDADFHTLQTKDKTVLADDAVKRDDLLLRPGEHRTIVRPADPTTTAIGVLAAYRDLPNSIWRAVYAMPDATDKAWYRLATPKVKLNIDLDAHAVEITETRK